MSADELNTAHPGSFFGVYILYNLNPKHKGKIYIGFAVNPARRIRQHNREIKGGARKTGGDRGPWDMVLITHGFNTKLAALQFEWAWQNPARSRHLSHLPKKKTKENVFSYRLRILSEMLNIGPWNRLPLTIQWLKQEYYQEFPINRQPPVHMPISYGAIVSGKKTDTKKEQEKNKESSVKTTNNSTQTCMVCGCEGQGTSTNKILSCIVSRCNFTSHTSCLAETFLKQSNSENDFLLPVQGTCPSCKQQLMWSDMIKQRRYSLEDVDFDDDDESEHSQDTSSDEDAFE